MKEYNMTYTEEQRINELIEKLEEMEKERNNWKFIAFSLGWAAILGWLGVISKC